MSSEVEAPKSDSGIMERLASERARERIRSARWDQFALVFAYATLVAVLVLSTRGVKLEVVAIVAIFGLALLWFTGWIRGRRQFSRFYEDELNQLQAFSSGQKAEAAVPSILTPRETEILSYIARGYMNKQIAHELGLSEHTIKNHLSSIIRKLEVNDRTQAVVLAINNGWITPKEAEPAESTTDN